MEFFVDKSSLAKRYLNEIGSSWVLSWIEPLTENIIIVSELTQVEIYSIFARRQREKTLDAENAAILQTDFLFHAQKEYLVVPLDTDILVQARQLLIKHPLRTLDAIQLSCAMQSAALLESPITFISSDKNLLAAALAEGFVIDDPNAHP
jgi:uncharacterized protein